VGPEHLERSSADIGYSALGKSGKLVLEIGNGAFTEAVMKDGAGLLRLFSVPFHTHVRAHADLKKPWFEP